MSADRPSPFEEPLRDPLPGVKKQLSEEPEEQIEEVAKRALDDLSSVRVKEFIPILAWRRAREELRRAS